MDNICEGLPGLSAARKERWFDSIGAAANDNLPRGGRPSRTIGKPSSHHTAICEKNDTTVREGTVRVIVGGEFGDTIFFLDGGPSR